MGMRNLAHEVFKGSQDKSCSTVWKMFVYVANHLACLGWNIPVQRDERFLDGPVQDCSCPVEIASDAVESCHVTASDWVGGRFLWRSGSSVVWARKVASAEMSRLRRPALMFTVLSVKNVILLATVNLLGQTYDGEHWQYLCVKPEVSHWSTIFSRRIQKVVDTPRLTIKEKCGSKRSSRAQREGLRRL